MVTRTYTPTYASAKKSPLPQEANAKDAQKGVSKIAHYPAFYLPQHGKIK